MTSPSKPTDSELNFHRMATAEDVDQAIQTLYGTSYLGTGILHVTSVWRKDPDTHLTLRIGPYAPPSPVDFFILNLARARADAILTTGKILRQEPELQHRIQGPEQSADALSRWRAERLGKENPPVSLVLTSGRDLDFHHPLFQGPGRVLVYTDGDGAWEIESRAADVGVEVVAAPTPTPRGALELLRAELGCATISVEAGPSVSRSFYEEPVVIDELMLSIFNGDDLPPQARGGRQVPPSELDRIFVAPAPVYRDAAEPDWEFHRWVRPVGA